MNQHDIKQELVNYCREADLRTVPMWLKDAIKAWVEAVDLNQDEYMYYNESKEKVRARTDYLSLDNLLELDENYDKFRDWFNRQKARFDRVVR
ncbi:MAG TPA: hypothetical protein VM901_01745 [Bdellovibrionota bacterium]|nr:hypothetical protein [Bdellovibrionota bacterium]